jgi:hypothetical protein
LQWFGGGSATVADGTKTHFGATALTGRFVAIAWFVTASADANLDLASSALLPNEAVIGIISKMN